MEFGRCVTEVKPEGLRRIDPLSEEVAAALYNAEHPGHSLEVVEMKIGEFKDKFPHIDEKELYEMAKLAKSYKKPGRPKKIKKEEMPPLPDGVTEISRSLNTKGGFAIDAEKFDGLPPTGLSKIETLKWLTAHPRK